MAWGWEDALNGLKKLRDSNGDKTDFGISEEIIRDNQRRQEDELLVLEAIYRDNLRIFDKLDDLLSFQISMHCDVPEGFKVSAKFNSGTGGASTSTNSEGYLYSFEVRFFPPIVLTCMLPKLYPSNHLPYFVIGTQWLNESKISSMCTMLDSIWREQLGQEVIFQWTEWLLNSSLSYLNFDEELILIVPDLEHTIRFMIRYNEERCHETFLNNVHQCVICFNEYLGSEFIKLPCQHLFCSNCMKTYCGIHVKEGSVMKLSCPSSKCDAHVPLMLLKALLDKKDYERWESLLLQKTLDAMSDVVYCPRCETPCLEDTKMNDAQCSKCPFSFCTRCKDKRHVGEECMDLEMKLRLLRVPIIFIQIMGIHWCKDIFSMAYIQKKSCFQTSFKIINDFRSLV